ncbi:olfactory receptor 1019-like [Bombina bombina]|uniref:olfactory receptor 1019-like n=1 Tax=Bombina bombina TaxID=8345 RepID=UPI00235B00ED|nr:olfactory receptor 1019-like [Bombina bombina]
MPIRGQFENNSSHEEFTLLGLVTTPVLQKLLFILLSVIYIMTLIDNVMVIVIIQLDSHLHTPMYFFLLHLALTDILYTIAVSPNTLRNLLVENKSISFAGCLMQMLIFISLGGTECTLLGIMAYDRYVAICHPLLYNTIMNQKVCIYLAMTCWAIGLLNSLVHTILTSRLTFCRDHYIQHYFCEISFILKLSCGETHVNEIMIFILGGGIIVNSLILTFVSYAFVIATVIRIPGKTAKYKTFSTCTSHITVVSIYFGTVAFIYLRPVSQSSSDIDRVTSLVYGLLTPFLNPIIYTLRNQEFYRAFQNLRGVYCLSLRTK